MADLGPLRDAGIDVDAYSDEERAALEALSQEEIDTLAAIREKLNSGGDEERASARAGDGIIVW
jgi:hypothetical protein